jgi:diguanylate cyclase (GGDEF)-like protein/PAS domain S-box-containing protein
VALIYFLFGITWIFVTDTALAGLDLPTDHWLMVSRGKGTLFVAISAVLLFLVVHRSVRSLFRMNSLLRAIIDGTTDCVFVKDTAGRYLLVNQAAAQTVGKPVAALIGQTDDSLFTLEDTRGLVEQDRRVIHSAQPETDEQTLTVAGGSRTFLTVKAPYWDENGTILGTVGISRDISDRKQAEVALRVREEFVREVLDSMPAHIAVLDKDGTIVSVNQTWLAFSIDNSNTSTSAPRTGVGTNYLRICDESSASGSEDARAVAAGIRTVLSGSNKQFELEYACPAPNKPRWFLLSAVPLGEGSRGVVISHTDITARKLAELQAQENEERYRLLFNSANDAIFVYDGVRFTDCNQRAVEMFGWPREQLLKFSPVDLSPKAQPNGEPSASILAKGTADVMAGNSIVAHWQHVRADGSPLETEVSLSSVVFRGTKFVQAVVRDVTERVANQRTIARLATFPELSPTVVIEFGRNGRVEYANPSAKLAFPDLAEQGDSHPILAVAKRLAENLPPDTVRSQPEEIAWGNRSYVGIATVLAGDERIRFYLTDVTPLRQAQAALAESETRFQALIENSADITGAFTPEGRYIYVSPSVRQLGYEPAEIIGTPVFERIHEDDRPAARAAIQCSHQAPGTAQRLQLRFGRRDGTWATLEVTGRFVPGLFASSGTIVINSRDVTDRVRAEEALRVRTNLYAMLSRTNRAVSHCQNTGELFQEVCNIAVEIGQLQFAWIGVAEGTVVKPAMSAGVDYGYLKKIVVSLDEHDPRSHGPTGRAFLRGESTVVNDFQAATQTAPWHDEARRAGFAASAAFPIRERGRVVAVLTIYAHTQGYFTDEFVTTLSEITPSLSFALDKFVLDRERQQASVALAESEARFRAFMDNSPAATWIMDPCGRIVFANRSLEEMLARPAGSLFGQTETDIQPSEFAAGHIKKTERVLSEGVTIRVEEVYQRPDGKRGCALVVKFPLPGPSGEKQLGGFALDVTETREAQERLRVLGTAIESSPNAVFITDRNGTIQWVNTGFTRMSGFAYDEAVGQNPRILRSGQQDSTFYRGLWQTILAGRTWSGEVVDRRKDGTEYVVHQTITPLAGADGTVSQFVAVQEDITASKRAEARLRNLAVSDTLTGLLNRSGFRDRLTAALNGEPLALHFLDLDRFKLVNDALGHHTGDQLLREVADRIRRRVRGSDSVGRLGGDEFAILQPGLRTPDDAAALAQGILDAINQPFTISGQEIRVGVSVGITLSPRDGGDPDDLLRRADLAMYRAKQEGRGIFRFFAPEMEQAVQSQLSLEGEIRQGLERREFVLHYQPQVRLTDGTVVGAEALIRWQHPTRGLLSPGAFLPVIEDTALIIPLSDWVLKEACAEACRWQAAGHTLGVAVNVSAVHVERGNLEASVEAALAETGLSPHLLELEVTEGLFLPDKPAAAEVLRRLRNRGIRVSIDDFGTGYSSLSYLRRLPVNQLKIDRSFVTGVAEDKKDAALVRAIIGLAHDLGLGVIAEGVETGEQLEFLRCEACDEIQGYLVSRPISAPAFGQYLVATLLSRSAMDFPVSDS